MQAEWIKLDLHSRSYNYELIFVMESDMEYVRLERDDPFSTYIKERIVQSIITDIKNKCESPAYACMSMCVDVFYDRHV